jgi:hypothetical protein
VFATASSEQTCLVRKTNESYLKKFFLHIPAAAAIK